MPVLTSHPFTILDVFAETRFAGNQLAVVRDASRLSTAQMQAIAREMNFSETTFVMSDEPREGAYDVRIFTPATELPFAGHPTLGTASTILEEILGGTMDHVTLSLAVGKVPVRAEGDLLWMEQPEPRFGAQHDPKRILDALGLEKDDLDPRYPVEEVTTGLWHVIVPLRSRDALRRVRLSAQAYDELARNERTRALLSFTTETDDKRNTVAVRNILPALGMIEDPATGSGNGCLAAYLSRHRVLGAARVDVRAEQGNDMGRPSVLHLQATPQGDGIGVRVGGRTIVVARGTLYA